MKIGQFWKRNSKKFWRNYGKYDEKENNKFLKLEKPEEYEENYENDRKFVNRSSESRISFTGKLKKITEDNWWKLKKMKIIDVENFRQFRKMKKMNVKNQVFENHKTPPKIFSPTSFHPMENEVPIFLQISSTSSQNQ